MILVCGGLADPVIRFFCERLEEHEAGYRFVDQRVFPCGYTVSCRWRNGQLTGWFASADWRIDFEELTGVYLRHLSPALRKVRSVDEPATAQGLHAENDLALESVFADLPCPVINRFAGAISNESKAYQALLIRRSRLLIPTTLITNDISAARQFYDEFAGRVIHKSLSGRSIGTRLLNKDLLSRLFSNSRLPLQLQEFIPGANIRVHVVGDRLIATRIWSDAVDYRFAIRENSSVRMEPLCLPPPIAEDCVRLSEECGILFAGIDLKETPSGNFYCFEINPSPGFSFFEQITHQPISLALIGLLRSKL
jgi:glutathione synthase/RimK-type ligase-like ATP-grasp enzyme